MRLAGQTALVTGASSGLGRALAAGLAERGVAVVGTTRREAPPDWPTDVERVRLDLASPEAFGAGWRQTGLDAREIGLLVNNAGEELFAEFAVVAEEKWRAHLETHLLAPIALARRVLPGMLARREGAIVNVSSLAAAFPVPFMAGYNAAKAGLSAFSASLRLEAGPAGVGTLDVQPGDFRSEFGTPPAGAVFAPERRAVGLAAWQRIARRMARGPSPERLAARVIEALEADAWGTLRLGRPFQAIVAPFLARFASESLKHAAIAAYYKLPRR